MKKIINKFAIIAFFFFVASACETREEAENFKVASGADGSIPVLSVTVGESSFFDLTNLDAAAIDLIINVEGNASAVEVYKTYNDPEATRELVTEVSSFPAELEITVDQAVAGTDTSKDALVPGDTFYFTFIMVAGGKEISSSGTAVSVSSACPSNLPTGTLTATSSGTSTDGCPSPNPVVDLQYDVTIEKTSGSEYVVSDFSAGLYQSWYGSCYGYTFETTGTFVDVCGDITFSAADAFGASVQGTGTYDQDTKELTIEWVNDFGDTGTWTVSGN